MTFDQMASFQPALAAMLAKFRAYFKRDKTFGYWQTYILGLMADVKRKSVEPIALAAEVPVRTLQEFLAFFRWDHQRIDAAFGRLVAQEYGTDRAIGVFDASAHAKRGDKTPGVKRQWCGESGKIDNCVVGQHLLYSDNAAGNAFSCVVASDLFLPKDWSMDRDRCRAAGIPDAIVHRSKWRIAIEQLQRAIGNGIRFSYVTFDEDYGQIPSFWFELDRLGQIGIGEVRKNFGCWVKPPSCRSLRDEHGARRVDNIARYSPAFRKQDWRKITIKVATRGPVVWKVKAARVHLVDAHRGRNYPSMPTDRRYWLIVAVHPRTGERKYFVSNASGKASLKELLIAAFARWRVEKWFERSKQEAGFGAFEVRTYTSLIRHWLSSRMAMYFLAAQTHRLRGEKSADNVRAGGRCGQHSGSEDLANVAAFVHGPTQELSVLPVA